MHIRKIISWKPQLFIHFIMFPYNGSIHIFLFCPGHERTRLGSSKSLCKCNGGESHGTCLRWNLQFGKRFDNCHGGHRAQQTCGSVIRTASPKPRAPVRAYLHEKKQRNTNTLRMDLSFSSAIGLHSTTIYTYWIYVDTNITISNWHTNVAKDDEEDDHRKNFWECTLHSSLFLRL
jgi:hypothetical protein